jgi:hypothetical protein
MTDDAANVLLGGALAIIGGLISQGISWLTLRKQLKHDEEEKKKERQYQTKKELYINLTENYSKFAAQIGEVQHSDFKPTLLSDIVTPIVNIAIKGSTCY